MKNLKVNVSEFIKRRGVPLVLAGTIALGLSGCGRKADCDIRDDHAHLYTDEDGFTRYLEKEYLEYEGFTRSDDYILIDKADKDLYKFEDKKDLFKIDENIDSINSLQDKNQDYIEYRYSYTYLMPIPHYIRTGKTTTMYYTYIPTTHYSWTTDKEHGRLTGEERRCHHVYQACNVVLDEKGKYVIVPSEYVDDINELNGEYKYIKKDFCKVIDAEYGYDLDYEDGLEDDPDLIEDGNVDEQSASNSYEDSQKTLIK